MGNFQRNLTIAIFLPIINMFSYAYSSWSPAVRIVPDTMPYDPRIEIHDSVINVVYWVGNSGNRSYYLRSTNLGQTWLLPFYLPQVSAPQSAVFPVMECNNDTIVIVWNQGLSPSYRNLGFRKSINGGVTWSAVAYILPTNIYEIYRHSIALSELSIFVIFTHFQDSIRFCFTKSINLGQTWSAPQEIFRAQETGPIYLVCRGDTLHLLWCGRFVVGEDWEIYYTKSEDGGNTWTQNANLSTIDDRGSDWPVISIDNEGMVVACWMDYKYSPYLWTGDLFIRYSYDAGDSWTDEQQLTNLHSSLCPQFSITGDSIHLVWQDERFGQEDIFYMLSSDDGQTWGSEQRVDSDPARSETPDIAISGQYRYVVWNDRRPTPGPGIYMSRWEPGSEIDDRTNNILPQSPELRAYPNPFNGSTLITYTNLERGEIQILNIVGQKIISFPIYGKEGQIKWDASDAEGNKVSSGIYFARAKASHTFDTIKLIYVK